MLARPSRLLEELDAHAQRLRLTDVQHAPDVVLEDVDTRIGRKLLGRFAKVSSGLQFVHMEWQPGVYCNDLWRATLIHYLR
jgi:hypothetical protein